MVPPYSNRTDLLFRAKRFFCMDPLNFTPDRTGIARKLSTGSTPVKKRFGHKDLDATATLGL